MALDLAEELRPWVDGMVLTLLNRRQLAPEDFVPADEEGGVHLGPVAKEILLRDWRRRLAERAPHPTRDEHWTVADLLVEQARQMARVILGEAPRYAALAVA
jgi:CRISPR-associated protein Cas1